MNTRIDKIEEITEMARSLFTDKLSRYRMEEEMLCALVKHPDYSLQVKRKAFERMAVLNKIQLEMTGQMLYECDSQNTVKKCA